MELRSQNDLLEQMSFTSAANKRTSSNGQGIQEPAIRKQEIDCKVTSAPNNLMTPEASAAPVDPHQVVATRVVEQELSDKTTSESTKLLDPIIRGAQEKIVAVNGEAKLARTKTKSKTKASKIAVEQRVELSPAELMDFVSTCVPKNKRVLCLIVRDKVSKFNQAKSYFYPTYYLFIQAIVDIDQQLALATASAAVDPMLGRLNESFKSDNDLNEHQQQQQLRNGAADKISASDNSFSASSSISADMMFIGAANAETSAGAAATGGSGGGRSGKQLVGNSYSDNELDEDENKDVELDDNEEDQLPAQTPDLNEHKSARVQNYARREALIRQRVVLDSTSSNLPNADTATNNKRNSSETLSDDEEDEDEDEEEDEDGDEANNNNNNLISRKNQCQSLKDLSENHQMLLTSLFDNDRNPYSGTYGVLLAGKKRKKAKT